MCVCIHIHGVIVHVNAGALESQKRGLDSLLLKLMDVLAYEGAVN